MLRDFSINELFLLVIGIYTVVKGVIAIRKREIKTLLYGKISLEFGEGAIIMAVLYILFGLGVLYILFFFE